MDRQNKEIQMNTQYKPLLLLRVGNLSLNRGNTREVAYIAKIKYHSLGIKSFLNLLSKK
jgi:hypothetical protein